MQRRGEKVLEGAEAACGGVVAMTREPEMPSLGINPIGRGAWGFDAFASPSVSLPSIEEAFAMAGTLD